MANTEKLKIAELDFDTIKSNLITFLREQDEFTDYNFEGSGLSVLLDLLAYNTHYMGFYLNMVANEMFLDTAITRPAVISHAKGLGYTPRSRVASQATLNVAFLIEETQEDASTLVLPRFTRFSANTKDAKSYIFYTDEQRISSKSRGSLFRFDNLVIKEGEPVGYTFVYDSQTNAKQVFELPDESIDTTTLQVVVKQSSQSSNLETYQLAEDATEVLSTSKVFYLEQNRNNKYQIYFGDDIIGRALTHGNIVIVSYLKTSGTEANGINGFKLIDDISGLDYAYTVTIELVNESYSGKMEETIESIKFTAPKSFISQNRAVTKNDYISMINKKYPYFDSVSVWGGEENDPPIYGKIFFSLKPRGNYEVSETEIEYIKNKVIAPISVLTVTPDYVAPDYNYLVFDIEVSYDPRRTSKSTGGLESDIYDTVLTFSDQYLNTFNNTLRISKLSRMIDDTSTAILNNEIKVYIEKRFQPLVGVERSYRLDFHVPLKKGTALEKLRGETSFSYIDDFAVERTAFIEEVPQSFTGIEEIQVVSPGSGFTQIPTVTIEGDGQGATASAEIVNGKLKSITVTNPGTDYSTAVITISGGFGSGATAKAILQGKRGTLRLYYIDSNGIKKVLDPEIGTIYYDDGYISIDKFKPTSVNDAYGTIAIRAIPNTTVFSSKNNSILTLDQSDPTAVKLNIKAEDS